MKRTVLQIAVLAGILLAVCVGCRLAMRNTYVARLPISAGMRGMRAEDIDNASGGDVALLNLHVSRLGTVYDYETGGFTGDSVALVAFAAFCLTVAAIMFYAYRHVGWPGFYGYGTIHAAGFSIFSLLTGLLMLDIAIRHIARPNDYSMMVAYRAITGASWRFMMATAPLLTVFAAAMAVSNIALLRHEGFRPKNVLGIGVGLLLVAGLALAHWLYRRELSGPARRIQMWRTLQNVYATGFAYFECMLIGAIICGIKAARHVPEGVADYILILGCGFRKDGTLTPLLRGRVDRAIEYWRRQKAATGREAVLMPSGGQGPDECMSEAEAMGRYLLEQGIAPEQVVLENRSRNTFQNMASSEALIQRDHPGARVVFSTTNYHVFRSGVWASLAGLPAEGMGSDTKWWYWPNAFIRECVGLFVRRIPQELLLLAALIGFFWVLALALG